MEIILAAIVSGLAQWLKKWSPNEYYTIGIVVALSLLAAAGYTALVDFGLWQSFAGILVMAGAIYTFIIARFE